MQTRLSTLAEQMGAVFKLDLTSDVTHLIVGSIATPKYRYTAKERPDIKVLHPQWIEAVNQAWIDGGDDIDVRGLEEQHRMRCFAGLQICLTGFDDQEERNAISSTVQHQGATYHGDLTKAVTHLIAAAPKGAKYTHAKQWNIKVVSLKWLQDSVRRGMAVDEDFYDPVAPWDEQGCGAFQEQLRPRTSLGKRPKAAEAGIPGDETKRKRLRRTASTRLQSQSQDMWHEISAQEIPVGIVPRDQWGDDATAGPVARPLPAAQNDAAGTSSEGPMAPPGLLSGYLVLLHGFDEKRTSLLRWYLEENRAVAVTTMPAFQASFGDSSFRHHHLLVPHAGQDFSSALETAPPSTVVATEWWLERCVHFKRCLDPAEDVLSRPLADAPIPDFSGLSISTTGFDGVDLRQVAEAVKRAGATYHEVMQPSTTILVNGAITIRKEKAFYACKHRIPIVSAAWLWQCLEARKREPHDGFRVVAPSRDSAELARHSPSAGSIPAKSDTS